MFATWRCLSAILILSLLCSKGALARRPTQRPQRADSPAAGRRKILLGPQPAERAERPEGTFRQKSGRTLCRPREGAGWSDLNGKFRTVASYVKHDANMANVTIETVKGRGAERQTKEVTVPVDKLSKNCQSRVKQIDTLQKKIKELSPPKPGEGGVPGDVAGGAVAAAGPEGGAPMPQAPAAPEPDPARTSPIH